jgi:F-type H+-transporting ATPase subunit delta
MVINFVNLLIDRKRIDQLPGIEMAFREKVDEIRGITRGEVVSAEALDEAEIARVKDALSKISGKQVVVTASVDPGLIGGLVAKVGDMVFDGTIRTQLNQLKESLRG